VLLHYLSVENKAVLVNVILPSVVVPIVVAPSQMQVCQKNGKLLFSATFFFFVKPSETHFFVEFAKKNEKSFLDIRGL
jgi:hypothetical protein